MKHDFVSFYDKIVEVHDEFASYVESLLKEDEFVADTTYMCFCIYLKKSIRLFLRALLNNIIRKSTSIYSRCKRANND